MDSITTFLLLYNISYGVLELHDLHPMLNLDEHSNDDK